MAVSVCHWVREVQHQQHSRRSIDDLAMAYAAGGGHLAIVQLMVDRGATNYDLAMAAAARGGHLAIVQLMVERGATNYNGAMEAAARGGHVDIVELLRTGARQ